MVLSISGVAEASLYALGVGATVDDLRRRKVANRWLAAGLGVAAVCLAALAANTALGERGMTVWGLGQWYLPPAFFGMAATHFALSTAAALTLWYLRVWPAGDAKLFIVLSSLLVLADHNLRGFPVWLSLATLINIFVAAGLFVTGIVFWEWAAIARRWARGGRRELDALADRVSRRVRDEWAKRYNYARLGWNTFVMFLAFGAALDALRLRLPGRGWYLAIYLGLYFAWRWLRALLIRKNVAEISFCALIFLVVPLAAYHRWDLLHPLLKSVKMTAGFDAFLLSFRRLVDLYLRATRRRLVDVSSLREGMVLAEDSRERLSSLGDGEEVGRYADGLSAEDLRAITGTGAGEVSIYWHRPFALWIFLGCLWTLYSPQTVVQWLTQLARR